ncbi:MAG: class I SAM-dependent methyltransferase [Anaerolineae bacterium]
MAEWWERFFDEAYLRLWAETIGHERTDEQVKGVRELLGLSPGTEILDLACGHGRHTVPLAQAGYRMTGLDLSKAFLETARNSARDAGVEIDFHWGDMREIPWRDRFDAVINLFTSFGFFEHDRENQQVLDGVFRALKPGGKFLIDLANRDRLMQIWQDRAWDEVNGVPLWRERQFEPVSGRVTETIRWLEDGQTRERTFRVRSYNATELTGMLQDAGLKPIGYYGDYQLAPFSKDTWRLIVMSEKGTD